MEYYLLLSRNIRFRQSLKVIDEESNFYSIDKELT